MASKAERLRRKKTITLSKGGRPRQQGPREANGRLNRKWRDEESERSAVKTAIEARQRLFGLPEAVCRQPEAMTVLGRLRLVEAISIQQFDAALDYQKLRVRYQRAIGATPDYDETPPPAWERTGETTFEDWVDQTKAQHCAMMDVLSDLCIEVRSPAPKAALDVIVHRDIDMPELAGALRLALNALERHFSGQKRRLPEVAA